MFNFNTDLADERRDIFRKANNLEEIPGIETETIEEDQNIKTNRVKIIAFERRGIRLVRMEDSYQLCSSPDYADVIRKAFEIRKTAKLSQPALEVLTIIAYYQPTTRAYIDQVRGVDSSYTVGLLLERGLIEECGRLQVPGRPRLYRTTKKFLRDFHLGSLEELPEMPGLEADGQLRMTEDGTILDPSAMTEKEGSIPENGEH